MNMRKNIKEDSYAKKLELFNEKIQEFISVVHTHNVLGRIENTPIEDIIKDLDVYNERYFSIEYFYDGLNNIDEITKGNRDNVHFMFWVITSILYEMFLRYGGDKIFDYFKQLYSGKYYYIIQTKNMGTTQIVLEFTDYEKYFITGKLSHIINSRKIKEIADVINNSDKKFQKICDDVSVKEKEINDMLSNYQTKAENIVDFIKKQQSKLNFVGLGHAFKQITKEKNTVKNNLEHYLTGFFIALILIPFCVGISLWCCGDPNYYICIPATTIELLLLYAFRLFYQQYMFVKSELLQVNLRHNLCAFIESYMEFKKDNKDNTVDLFEQLIFSNIISDEKKVPATVDGLDSIANIIQAVKGK